ENKKAAEDYLAAVRINPDYASAYTSLGRIHQSENRYGDAEEQYRKAVGALEKRPGPADIALADALSDLAFVKSNQGDVQSAASLWERSLAIHERIEGKDHINVASSLAFLASAYSFGARFQDAETALQRALSIAEGKQNLWTTASINYSLAI